jgi:hypothetical protein
MVIICPYCNGKLKCNDNQIGKRGRCPQCGKHFEATSPISMAPHAVNETQSEENPFGNLPFFRKIKAYLTLPRRIQYQQSKGRLKIQYFWVPSNELKKNWLGLWFVFIGFGVLPIVLGIPAVLIGLIASLEKSGEDPRITIMMFMQVFSFLIPPVIVYLKLVKPVFARRTILLEPHSLAIQDTFFESNPKMKLSIPKQQARQIIWKGTTFFEKMHHQKNEKLVLIHEGGKLEVISTYPEFELQRIQNIFQKYLAGNTIETVQKESEQVQKSIEDREDEYDYPIYKLLFYHVFGKQDVKLAPLTRYLGVNAVIGGLGIFSVIMDFLLRPQFKELQEPADIRFMVLQGVLSAILLAGWALNKLGKSSESQDRQFLGLGGLIIFSYSIYMIYSIVPGMKEALESATNIHHSPGLITFLVSYGFWLICQFGPLQNVYQTENGRYLPRIVFIAAALIDLYILFLFLNAVVSRTSRFIDEGHRMMNDSLTVK